MHIALISPLRSSRLGMPSRSPLPSLWCLDNLYLILVSFWSTLVQCQGSLWWSPYPQRFGLASLIAYKFPVTQFNCRATRGDTVLLLLTTFVMFWDKLSLAGLVHHSMIPFTTNRDNHRLTTHLLDHQWSLHQRQYRYLMWSGRSFSQLQLAALRSWLNSSTWC